MFNLFGDDNKTAIEKYFDSLGYFEKRAIIVNTLHNRVTDSPFSPVEIINYANKEAQEGYFNASNSALNGAENDIFLIGKPEYDPVTGIKNSKESQKGLFGKIGDGLKDYMTKIIIIIVCLFLFFNWIKK
jgi:hypothetical protein